MTTMSSSGRDKPKEREKDPRGNDSSRRFTKPAGIFFRTSPRSLPPPRFPSALFPSRRDFSRRLITPRRSSHKTLFNLNQRERVYYTCWSSTDAFPFCFFLSLFLSPLPVFIIFFSFEFCEVTKGWKTPWRDSTREFLLILCDATLINSRRCSGIHASGIRRSP